MSQSVSNLFQMYLSRSVLRRNSVALKERALKHWLKIIGDKPLADVSYEDVEDYRNVLVRQTSPQTAKIYIDNMAPMFKWATKRKFIERNVFDELDLPAVGLRPHRVYTEKEMERLLKVCDTRWKVIICLGLLSMRRAEVLNMCVSDIRFDENYIMVQPKAQTEFTWHWEVKDHDADIIPLPAVMNIGSTEIPLQRLILELIDNLPQNQPYVCWNPLVYQRVLSRRGELKEFNYEVIDRTYYNFSRQFGILRRRAKVGPGRFHDLRGTFATQMAKHGMKLTEVQSLMRHSSPVTTQRYYLAVEKQELVNETIQKAKFFYVS